VEIKFNIKTFSNYLRFELIKDGKMELAASGHKQEKSTGDMIISSLMLIQGYCFDDEIQSGDKVYFGRNNNNNNDNIKRDL
jgi:hypothetical protein